MLFAPFADQFVEVVLLARGIVLIKYFLLAHEEVEPIVAPRATWLKTTSIEIDSGRFLQTPWTALLFLSLLAFPFILSEVHWAINFEQSVNN